MLTTLALLATLPKKPVDALANAFRNPPASARPHTWWHWMNGNVTKEGITADLEAMKEAGIGGAQMFTVDQGIPHGPAGYAGPLWRELTAHAVKEANRLGLELCIHNCAGWSSSGGPWIKPEDAMQVIAWSKLEVSGPGEKRLELPRITPPQIYGYVDYRKDIAVYAFPTPAEGDFQAKSRDILGKTGVVRADGILPDLSPAPAGIAIPKGKLIDLTHKVTPDGHLNWNVPDGNWTILRIGHVPTGKDNHPAPPEGDGLEVDKLSATALDHHWAGLMAKVLADAGPLAGKSLNNSLIDSYEVGSQNWSPKFREEFQKRRGYDPLPYLPVITGVTVDSKEISERFLWDMRRTIADLFADNYYGHFAELCHKAGIKFSTEPYGNGGFDNIQSGSKADIVMGEFWIGGAAMESVKLASSVAHVYGRNIVGAESFTADEYRGRWLEEPYTAKALGDFAYCQGLNRYIFHRYAAQPWVDVKPGMTMGPWGSHLERTQTWWTEAKEWLRYVARCQYMLQQGRFVADVCYFYGEDAPADLPFRNGLKPEPPAGADYDGCDAQALLSMRVENGRVVLPSGMSYRVLVLPDRTFMTPRVVNKVRELVAAGATVWGPKPQHSPSLSGYPATDREVRQVAQAVWGDGAEGAHSVGRGKIYVGTPLDRVLANTGWTPDFSYTKKGLGPKLTYIHRKLGEGDVYFVSNQNYRNAQTEVRFRVADRVPELWHADTGRIEDAPAYHTDGRGTSLSLSLAPAESVFVVFRRPEAVHHLVGFAPTSVIEAGAHLPKIDIVRARYESADGRGTDVTDRVRRIVQGGETEIPATNDLFGDPVVNVVKQLTIEYRVNGQTMRKTAHENEVLALVQMDREQPSATAYDVQAHTDGSLDLTSWKVDTYKLTVDSGGTKSVRFAEAPYSLPLDNNWNVAFPPNLGAPASARFPKLISWPEHSDPGIKYFSGSATYTRDFDLPADFVRSDRVVRLNLGAVKNFATVSVNGRPVATLWKPPFAVDVTPFVRPGRNHLSVKVTNLWPNRIIGDEQLPPEVEWDGNHLKKWPNWLTPGKAHIAADRPKTGRITFATWRYWSKDSPLLESGLIGPVKLESARKVRVKF